MNMLIIACFFGLFDFLNPSPPPVYRVDSDMYQVQKHRKKSVVQTSESNPYQDFKKSGKSKNVAPSDMSSKSPRARGNEADIEGTFPKSRGLGD